jgi:hypothetical protein
LSTGNPALLNISLAQWLLESSALLDTTANIFRHINDWDARLWATGNGWMLYGAVRLVRPNTATHSFRSPTSFAPPPRSSGRQQGLLPELYAMLTALRDSSRA